MPPNEACYTCHTDYTMYGPLKDKLKGLKYVYSKSELLDPIAIYKFLDAATKSLTIDSQLGGVTGLYDLGESLRSIPSSKIAFFTVPNFPRGEVVPGDDANVLWTQPEDNEIFASFRNDVPASSTLFGPAPSSTKPSTSIAAGLSAGSTQVSPSATPKAGTTRRRSQPRRLARPQAPSRSRHAPPTSPSAQADGAHHDVRPRPGGYR